MLREPIKLQSSDLAFGLKIKIAFLYAWIFEVVLNLTFVCINTDTTKIKYEKQYFLVLIRVKKHEVQLTKCTPKFTILHF